MSKVKALHRTWSRDTAYRAACDEQGSEFELARALIEARVGAGLTQAQLAEGMKTTQSVVARLEGGACTRPPRRWDGSPKPLAPDSRSVSRAVSPLR